MLIVTPNKEINTIFDFFAGFRRRLSSTYDIKIDSVSSVGVDVLGIHLYKPHDFGSYGKLAFKPFFKASNARVWLWFDSNHARHVLRSWPIAEARRIARRSSNLFNFNAAKRLYVSQLRTQIPQSILTEVANTSYHGYGKRRRVESLWWVMPYNDALYSSGFAYHARKIFERWKPILCRFVGFRNIDGLRLAWRNTNPSLMRFMRNEQKF